MVEQRMQPLSRGRISHGWMRGGRLKCERSREARVMAKIRQAEHQHDAIIGYLSWSPRS